MVLMNATNRSRHTSSVINQNSGGGSKKAGLPPMIGLSSWEVIAYNTRGLPQPLSFMRLNRFSRPASQNLPLGFRSLINMR
jgi:hypothetical protein